MDIHTLSELKHHYRWDSLSKKSSYRHPKKLKVRLNRMRENYFMTRELRLEIIGLLTFSNGIPLHRFIRNEKEEYVIHHKIYNYRNHTYSWHEEEIRITYIIIKESFLSFLKQKGSISHYRLIRELEEVSKKFFDKKESEQFDKYISDWANKLLINSDNFIFD